MDSTLRSNPQLSPQRLPTLVGAFLVLLYALGLAFGFELSSHWLGHLNAHGHAHLHPHGHPFVDARAWLCVPNAADTLSNLPFALMALWGLRLQALRGRELPAASRAALGVLWLGLFLTALGSGLYHWLPTPVTLMADRLGMAVAFAGALALSTAGLISQTAAWRALALLLPAATLAACLPLQGNLLPWLVVQFGGVLWLLLAAFGPRQADALAVRWGWVVAAYAVAKVFEVNDAPVFHATADWGVLQISGHTLKHFVAAAAVLPVLLALQKLPRQ